jgi:hypothetical protein
VAPGTPGRICRAQKVICDSHLDFLRIGCAGIHKGRDLNTARFRLFCRKAMNDGDSEIGIGEEMRGRHFGETEAVRMIDRSATRDRDIAGEAAQFPGKLLQNLGRRNPWIICAVETL